MKIEIAESLCYSWLRHVIKCQIVQTNWKSSDNWLDQNSTEYINLHKIYKDAQDKEKIKQYLTTGTSKKVSFEQFLRQAEIDVLGRDNNGKFYAIDVAFHENGLRYTKAQQTKNNINAEDNSEEQESENHSSDLEDNKRVVKKLIRAAFCLKAYFNAKEGEIIFATPIIEENNDKELGPRIAEAESFINETFGFDVKFIRNENFYTDIMEPTIAKSENNSDTAELFMRAYTLYELCPNDIKELNILILKVLTALQTKKINNKEITQLKGQEYTQKKFGIDKALLSTQLSEEYNRRINKRKLYLCKGYIFTDFLQKNHKNLREILKKINEWLNQNKCQ